jgi:type IV pilus assembly protein PilV
MRPRPRFVPARQRGFTLIEVMIAVLILGFGLLAFGLLQTMNVRFTKSAQQRTIASNLAYEVVDLMRTQRTDSGLYAYSAIDYASFASVAEGDCETKADASIANNIARWKCQVKNSLPEGAAQVQLESDGKVTVTVRWGDAPWETEAAKKNASFTLESRI